MHKEVDRAAQLEVQIKKVGGDKEGIAAGAGAVTPEDPAALFLSSSAKIEQDVSNESLRELRLKNTGLELELAATESKLQEQLRQWTAALEAEQSKTAMETKAALALQQQLDAARSAAQEAVAAKLEAETRRAALEAASLTAQALQSLDSREGDAVLIKSLTEQLKTAEAAAHEAAKVRDLAAQVPLLKERLDASESRATRAESLLDAEASIHQELVAAQNDLRRWAAVLSGVGGASTPEDVLRMLRKLQDEQVGAAAAAGSREELLAEARAEAAAAEAEARDAQAKAAEEKSRAAAAEDALARAERKADLAVQERESFRAILASYDEEYAQTLNHHHTPPQKEVIVLDGAGDDGDADGGAGSFVSQQMRICSLEAIIESLRQQIHALEKDLSAATAARADEASSLAEATVKADAAERRAAVAERDAETLAKQVGLLQERLASGEFDPAKTRVLHLKSNPETDLNNAKKDARIAELESENEALKENLQRLEATVGSQKKRAKNSSTGLDEATMADIGALKIAQLEGEINLLRKRVSEGQKISDRLQQVFTRQISTFREAMGSLFGYRVEMTSDPTATEHKAEFRLKPISVTEPGSELLFRMMRDGRLVMIPTEYSKRRLTREVETFVDRFGSIPAFTANLTMETFQKTART